MSEKSVVIKSAVSRSIYFQTKINFNCFKNTFLENKYFII